MRAAALLLAMTVAQGAWAACPIAGDLDDGIRMTFADGETRVFRSRKDGTVEVTGKGGPGSSFRDVLARGVYLVSSSDMGTGAPTDPFEVVYQGDPGDLPAPAEGPPLRLDVVERADGEDVRVIHEFDWTARGKVDVGGCAYRALDGVLRVSERGALVAVEHVRYLPELGFGYLTATGASPSDLDPTPAVAIEAPR